LENEGEKNNAVVSYNSITKTIMVDVNFEIHSLMLFNLNGQLSKASYQKNEIKINDFTKGLYFLIINEGEYHLTKKIIINY